MLTFIVLRFGFSGNFLVNIDSRMTKEIQENENFTYSVQLADSGVERI